MTAMNIIVQARAKAAFLITDTASYGRDGTIAEFRSKAVPVSIGGRRIGAIAATGMGGQDYFVFHALRRLKPQSLLELLSNWPRVFREIEQEMVGRGHEEQGGTGHMSMVIAAYDHDAKQPVGYAISNDNMIFPAQSYRPYSLQPVERYLTRFVGAPFPPSSDICDSRQWIPERDAIRLIEAQRADLFGLPGNQFYAVGGQAVLVRVDANGVHRQVLTVWPDRVGRKINPAAQLTWRDRLIDRSGLHLAERVRTRRRSVTLDA